MRKRRKKKEAKNFASNFAKLNLQSPRVNSTTTRNCYSLIRWHITDSAAAASGPISPTEQRASFIKILLSAADDDDDDDVADACLFFMPVAVVRLTENLLFNF